MSTATIVLLVTIYCITIVFGRNYSIGIKVSSLWYSGSSDVMYFQICNDNLVITNTSTNTSTPQDQCLEWYEINGGMENRGEWYYFDYLNQDDLGTLTSMKLLTKLNDQFCVSKVSMDGVKYDDETVDCMEVSDNKPSGSCSVISVTFATATFENDGYEGSACTYDISNAFTGPEITIENGTRTYELSLTVSNWFYSGTKNDLYLRLCRDSARTDCSLICDDYSTPTPDTCEPDWFIFVGGVNEEGLTYKGYWNTKDIGNVNYADIVTFGPDKFCLSRLDVDGVEANAGTFPSCIADDTKDGCATLSIDIKTPEFGSTEVEQCSYGIKSNTTFVGVDQFLFKFKTGSLIACGAEATIFFIFCNIDGGVDNNSSCSRIYEIGGQMPDEDTEYTYTIDVRDYGIFNTLSDIFFVDVWEYETERFCLSDITINGKILETGEIIEGPNADSGIPSITIESPVDDGVFCNGVRVTMQTNTWVEFNDGPIKQNENKKCRWNPLKNSAGTILVSKKSDNQSWLDWMNAGYNWIYICAVLIGIVICCIVGCACLQAVRKKQKDEVEDTNRPWHGGNSAFYS